MHITVLHAGPQDSASSAEVDQLVAEVTKRAAGIAPYEVTLSRPDIGTVAIESKGYPGAPCFRSAVHSVGCQALES
ncbi:hypothetical protein [Streptomyces sp. NPDC002994]|uniref:hypothetical protein n=1 Tax=Streptomyces sp. NPDC002994 TaxID=3154441 RepID=UPI0033B367D2